MEDVTVNIYDSPGLQDEIDDLEYLRMIANTCPTIHLIVYCKMMQELIRPAEKAVLKTLTRAFGSSIWGNTIIALTFANRVQPDSETDDEVEYFKQIMQYNVQDFERIFRALNIKEELLKN